MKFVIIATLAAVNAEDPKQETLGAACSSYKDKCGDEKWCCGVFTKGRVENEDGVPTAVLAPNIVACNQIDALAYTPTMFTDNTIIKFYYG